MSTVAKFTLRDYFQAKGGYLRHCCDDTFFQFELGISGVSCTFKSSAGLEAFRVVESEFKNYLPDEFHLDRSSSGDLGLDFNYLREYCVGATFPEKYRQLAEIKHQQAAFLDSFGFVKVRKDLVKCSVQEYLSVFDKRFDVIVCESEEQKERFKSLVSVSADGAWSGLEYTLARNEGAFHPVTKIEIRNKNIEELAKVFTAWSAAEWINFEDLCPGGKERKIPSVGESVIGVLMDEDARLIKKLRKRVSVLSAKDSENQCWGGLPPPSRKEARESFIPKTFPLIGMKMRARQFVQHVAHGAKMRWKIDAHYDTPADQPNLRMLAIGQIVGAGEDISYTEGGSMLTFLPRLRGDYSSQGGTV